MKKFNKILSLLITVNLLTVLLFQRPAFAPDKISYTIDAQIAASLIKLARALLDIFEDCNIERSLGPQKNQFLEHKENLTKTWRDTTFMGFNPEVLVDAHTVTRKLIDSLARLGLLLRPLASNNSFPDGQNCNQRIRDFFGGDLFKEFNAWRNRQRMEHENNARDFDFNLNPEFVVSPQQSTYVCTETYSTKFLPALSLIGLGLIILLELDTLNVQLIPKTLSAAALACAAMWVITPAQVSAAGGDFELGIKQTGVQTFEIERKGLKADFFIDEKSVTIRSSGLECLFDLKNPKDTANLTCQESEAPRSDRRGNYE